MREESHKFKPSLRRRILVYLGGTVLFILAVVIGIFSYEMYKTMLSDRLYTIQSDITSLAHRLEVLGADYTVKEVNDLLEKRKPFESTEFILFDKGASVITSTLDSDFDEAKYKSELKHFFGKDVKPFRDTIKDKRYFLAGEQLEREGWFLVMLVLEEELVAPIRQILLKVILFALFGTIFIFIILGRIVNSILNPIGVALGTTQKVASGDLTAKIEATSDDEMGLLLESFKVMTGRLHSLIGEVKKAVSQVMNTTEEIGKVASDQESNVKAFVDTTKEVLAVAGDISETSGNLAKEVLSVSDSVRDTTDLASRGSAALIAMEETMQKFATRTDAMSSKFAGLVEKAGSISSVVDTISNVADYTDLLSLNASIEAAKAGEQGAGFGTVAREVRRLADQTSYATGDIEVMIKDMQKAVQMEVANINSFAKDVYSIVGEVGVIKGQLEQIIGQVQALEPYFKVVDDGMRSQLQGAETINSSMQKLKGVAEASEKSLLEFNQASQHLTNAASGLEEEISYFKLR